MKKGLITGGIVVGVILLLVELETKLTIETGYVAVNYITATASPPNAPYSIGIIN